MRNEKDDFVIRGEDGWTADRFITIGLCIALIVFVVIPVNKYQPWAKVGLFIEKVWPTKK